MPGGPSGRGSDPAGAPSSPGLVLRVGSLPRDEIRQASSAGKHQETDSEGSDRHSEASDSEASTVVGLNSRSSARTPATCADCPPCAAPCAAGSAAPAPNCGLRACAPSSPPSTAAPRPLSQRLRPVFPARAKNLSCELTGSRLWDTNPFQDVAIFYSRGISKWTIQSDDPQIPRRLSIPMIHEKTGDAWAVGSCNQYLCCSESRWPGPGHPSQTVAHLTVSWSFAWWLWR